MNDVVLSALMNLFALFGAIANIDNKKARIRLLHYLQRFFGIRNSEIYLKLHNDLRDLYDHTPELDKDQIVDSICSRLQENLESEERFYLLLRFMEFSAINRESFETNFSLFRNVACKFGLSPELTNDFRSFIAGVSHPNVRVISFLDGQLKILKSPGRNTLVVAFTGNSPLYMNDVPMLQDTFVEWPPNSVLKDRMGNVRYHHQILQLFETTALQKLMLSGRNLEFRFPNSDHGLHDFSFDLHAGELVAIMGGSGVGKTTLIGLLNGGLKPVSGLVTLNGKELSRSADLIGFVPQDDLLISELTVYENLWYTSRFCFDTLSREAIDQKIDNLLNDLGLMPVKYLRVGSPLDKTISGGQRKRVNIALELIREPAVLLLDEPTSGLSSVDSEKVITLLKEQTLKGKLVVLNIHQPSSDIYKQFDRLWLLDKGGYPVYDGNPIEAINYFKQAVNYADWDVATCLSCGTVNPEVILRIIDSKTLDNSGRLTGQRKIEPEDWHQRFLQHQSLQEINRDDPLPCSEQKRPGCLKQIGIYLRRNTKTKLSDKQFLLIAFLEAPLLAAIVSYLTRYPGDNGYTLLDNKNLMIYFFMAIIVSVFMGMSISAEEIFRDRALLKRVKFLRLSYGSYIWSKIIFLAVISLVQTLLFILAGNRIIAIPDLFGEWWAILFTSALLSNLIGLLLSQRLRSIVAIYITIPLLLIPQILLCGLVVPFDDLNRNSKTNNVPVIGDLIPTRWSLEALSVASFTGNHYNGKFFATEQRKYEAQYYHASYIPELEKILESSYLEFCKNESGFDLRFPVLQNGIRHLVTKWELPLLRQTGSLTKEQFNDSLYHAVGNWLADVKTYIFGISNQHTKALDQQIKSYLGQNNMTALVNEKKRFHNTHLEETLVNFNARKACEIKDDVIVARAGMVYLDPPCKNGRAPFYSHVKLIGDWRIHTFWFNLAVLWLMIVIVSLILFYPSFKQLH